MNPIEKKIIYSNGGSLKECIVKLKKNEKCILEVIIDGKLNVFKGGDFLFCFRKLMEGNQSLVFYCKGAKINVVPSRMSQQMTMGLSAYETSLGKQARKEDLVDIFDYENNMLVSDPLLQDEYRKKWFSSLGK